MLDDFRLEWLCRRTCHMLNIERSIFVGMLERNNGFNEDLIEKFLHSDAMIRERLYALIFYREDSRREVWQMFETLDDDDIDEFGVKDEDENEEQIVLTINEPVDAETEYPMDYVFNNARSSTHDTIDLLYENLRSLQRLLVVNQYDNKHYHFVLKSYHEVRLYCEYQHYHNIVSMKKSFVYFIRIDSQQSLLQSSTFDEMNAIMNETIIEGTVSEQHSLESLVEILSLVYNHLLPPVMDQPSSDTSERDQLRVSLNRFCSQIQSTVRQMQGEFTLTIPTKTLSMSGEETEEEYIENLEYLLYDWEGILHEELNNELNRRVIQPTPLAEIEYWHERSVRITSILEQMKRDDVMRIIHMLTDLDSPSVAGFNNIKSQLQNYLLEAMDNYKFLLTIERHLKTLQTAKSFQTVSNMLPNLMQGLKTIWTMSKHYNKDERFVPFMEKIADEIINRVRQTIDLATLFTSNSLTEIEHLCSQAKQLLLQWKTEYQNVRVKLENDKRGFSSWNFDHRILFDKTDYMSQIVDDIMQMSLNLKEFYDTFSFDMKAVTGDEQMVDRVLQHVTSLKKSFISCQFDIFNRENAQRWHLFMDDFKHRSSMIEQEAKVFIRVSFNQLRSAETALDMLMKFQQIDTNHVLAHEMMRQFTAILSKYSKEIDTIFDLFNKQKDNPPLVKGYPPVSGAIQWARFLFTRIKLPMMKLRSLNQFLQSEQGAIVKQRFIDVGTQLKEYEDDLYAKWVGNCMKTLPNYLKQSLLIDVEQRPELFLDHHIHHVPSHRLSLYAAKKDIPRASLSSNIKQSLGNKLKSHKEKCHRLQYVNDTLGTKKKIEIKYLINYDADFKESLIECYNLEKLGFVLPESIRQTTLQYPRFEQLSKELRLMLEDYHLTLASLDTIEVSLLQSHLDQLQTSIKPGTSRISFGEIGTIDYIKECRNHLEQLHSILNQIRKISSDIREHLDSFRLCIIDPVVPRHEDGSLLTCREYFGYLERKRKEIIANLKRRFELIGPILTKIESLVFGTNTGKHKNMRSFYIYWEHEIFTSLVELVIRNLCQFFENIFGASSLFTVEVVLAPPRIKLQPSLEEIINSIRRSAYGISELPKYFIRWLHGTCISCPLLSVSNDEIETPDFTFYNDVRQHGDVISMLKPIRAYASGLVTAINHILTKLLTYNDLWKNDKQKLISQFISKSRHYSDYDEMMSMFSKVDRVFDHHLHNQNLYCIQLSLKQFYQALKYHCQDWIHHYGQHLYTKMSTKLKETNDVLNNLSQGLCHDADTVPDLKYVLNIIDRIHQQQESIEHTIDDIEQSYRILHEHQFEYPQSDSVLIQTLKPRLKDIVQQSHVVQHRLKSIRERFREIIHYDVEFFQQMIDDFVQRFDQFGPYTIENDLHQSFQLAQQYQTELHIIEQRKIDLINVMKLFHISLLNHPQLTRVHQDINNLHILLNLYNDFKHNEKLWANILWSELDINQLIVNVDSFVKTFRRLPSEIKSTNVGRAVERYLIDFRSSLPIMLDLKHEALRERHWQQIIRETNVEIDLSSNVLTLDNIFQMNLHQYQEIIQNILQTSIKELQIEKNLKDIEQQWNNMRFQIQKHTRNTSNISAYQDRGFLISGVDEILQALEDSILLLNSITTSRFVGIYLSQVEQWIRVLSLISDVIKIWTIVQQKWMYLENIFIGSSLQHVSSLMIATDRYVLLSYVLETSRNSLVKDACTHPGRYDDLKSVLSLTEKIQKSLHEYLGTKRQSFPRFYFISDDELLSIIGSSNSEDIQGYLQKMFDNIAALNFIQQENQLSQEEEHQRTMIYAIGMVSMEREEMKFVNPVECYGKVEVWMSNIEKEMKYSNRSITKDAIFYYRFKQNRLEWMRNYIGMVVLAVNQLWSTWEIEDQFNKMTEHNQRSAMKFYVKQLNVQIEEIVFEMQKSLTTNEYNKYETVLTIDVHTRDMVDILIRDGINEPHDFAWQSQLRFYWLLKEDNLYLEQCNGKFPYGYEYMGLNGRLVITPLTDRIYLTITQALSMFLGCAPAGPAGTGKTESVKDLAKAMGLLCVVTNCGEGMDYQAIGKNLNGLCQTGAWGCFDEFNRIEASVLSVISTQVKTIQQALVLRQSEFLFEYHYIHLRSTVGIFVTMNPGYAGRTELPESVKTLFRPVVVVVPDMQYIGEIKLFANGFLSARVLAKKMVTLYRYASELISKQYHYDWSLRSFKAVLSMAGYLKRTTMRNDREEIVLLRALQNMNVPKFISDDVTLFHALLNDLFPDIHCPQICYEDFNRIIEATLTDQSYSLIPEQIEKIIQLYKTMMTRHSTMLVGPTSGGKTVILNILAKAQTQMGIKTSLYTLNPKAVNVIELYGILDPLTREWSDGIVSLLFRMINQSTTRNERRCIVFDGDVDALWIENMNSVMDDNKLLTLANGERIRLQDHCSLLFEVGDLKYASPATVSRCGMIYVDPDNLGPGPVWKRWLNRNFIDRSNDKHQLELLYDRYVQNLINLIYQGITDTERRPRMKMIVPLTSVNIIVQLTKLLDFLFLSLMNNDKKNQIQLTADVIHAIFLQAMAWSFGACLKQEDRITVDGFIKYLSGLPTATVGAKAKSNQIPHEKPLLFDHVFHMELNQWQIWDDLIPKYEHDRSQRFTELFVPTVDTVRLEWLLQSTICIHQPVLFVGDTGSSKTATILSYIRRFVSQYVNLKLNFSFRTKSTDVQRSIESHLEKRSKDTYGPSAGTKLIVFLDDVSMPKIDQYGTQQAIAFLKLLIEKQGMYERSNELNWKFTTDIEWIAAMGTPGGSSNHIDPRFLSHFSVFYIPSPSHESLFRIFSTILQNHVVTFCSDIQDMISSMVNATLEIYNHVLRLFVPTPLKSHYIFSLRDLSRIVQSLLQTSPERFNTKERFVRVWIHECIRVFSDRFNDVKDHELFMKILEDNCLIKDQKNYLFRSPILYADYRTALHDGEPKIYEDVQDYPAIRAIFDEIVVEFKDQYGNIDIVLFDDALVHITRIYRVLRLDRGHLLLIGTGGSGKKLLAKIAAFVAKYVVFEIQLTRNYNESSFREDMKVLFNQVGLKNIPTVFLLTDAQIIDESFLEYINNILANGMIPTLFSDEERDSIISEIREEALRTVEMPSNENIWDYFVHKCTWYLHVVLCMNPSGDLLRNRIRNFPALINNTTIDYFARWPSQALFGVAEHFISRFKAISDELKTQIIEHMAMVHESANFYCDLYVEKMHRSAYATPKNYFDFIQTFLQLYRQKFEDLMKQTERLNIGIVRIDEASVLIEEMDKKLEKQRKELAIKTKKCDDLLEEITTLTSKQTERKSRALEKKQVVDEQMIIIAKEKHEAEEQLEETMPALLEAQQGLDTLKAADITEMRSFVNPVDALRLIGYCMLIYLGHSSISWKDVRAVMADMKFITNLKTRDPDSFTSKQATQLKIHLKKLEEKLDSNHLYSSLEKSDREMKLLTLMTNVSRVGGGLLKFIHAVDNYMDKYRETKPKKDRLLSIESDYETNLLELNRLESSIEKYTTLLNDSRKRFDAAMEDKIKFQEETDIATRRRTAADKLLTGFKSEISRWTNELQQIKEYEYELIGNCLLSSAFLAYCSPFTYEIRQELIYNQWETSLIEKKILFSEKFQVQNFLSTNVQISEWTSQGLPADEFSIQNGILTLQTNRFPYCIDPQLQGLSWIKQREKKANLKILSMKDRDFLKHLELAVKYGYPVLFKDVDEYIDPIILDILSKNVQGDSNRQSVKLGDKLIDIDRNFRMYLTCRLSNPHLTTLHFSYSKVINYTVTLKGLEEQLLSSLVKIERRELEEMRDALIQEIFENKQQQKTLEDSLLRELTTTTGNILDNIELVETLENTKIKVKEVIQALSLGERTRFDIENLRDTYRSAARRGAVLYFSLIQMSTINPMYQYSLNSFLSVFEYSVKTSQANVKLDKRLQSIINTLTYQIYCYGTMGTFEKHKLLYSFLLTTQIEFDQQRLTSHQIDFFLKGNVSLDKSSTPTLDWLTFDAYHHCLYLSKHFPDKFHDLLNHIQEKSDEWKQWYEHDRPETFSFPKPFDDNLTDFEKLMLLRCFVPNRIIFAINNYITKIMGQKYIIPPTIYFDAIFDQSTAQIPIIFVLSPGSDPTNDIQKLSERKTQLRKITIEHGNNSNSMEEQRSLRILAMGQGQEKLALQALHTAQYQGTWLLLQNCHLLLSFLNELEKELEIATKPHPDFRLWMTTEPIERFPIGLLQKSYKVVIEPPSTLKLNLRSTFANLNLQTFSESDHPAYPPLIFVLAFFHAVILDRRKYEKIGWSCTYDFNESDFRVSVDILKAYLNMSLEHGHLDIPWPTLRYLIGEVMYGGRVIDSYDRRIIHTYMKEFFGDFVFDHIQPFHFFRDTSSSERYDYFVPEIRDFLSAKQRWLLKEANLSVEPQIEYNFEKFLPAKISNLLHHSQHQFEHTQIDYKSFSKNVLFNQFFHYSVFRDFYQTYVDQLPLYNPPDVLGLHGNAEINYLTKVANEIYANMILIQPEQSEIQISSSREQFVRSLIDDILQQIPPKKDLHFLKQRFQQRLTPLTTVLFQEIQRYNYLTSIMWKSINELKQALNGQISFSIQLDEINKHLYHGQIPLSWRSYTPQTKKSLANWMELFRQRNLQYEKWIYDGELKIVNLSRLHVPESYLAAIVQIAARKNQWPLDRARFDINVTNWQTIDDIDESTQGMCLLEGLYLEGARWDRENYCLIDQLNKQLIQVMPLIKIIPSETHRVNLNNSLAAPVYVTSDRRNAMGIGLVFEVNLPTKKDPSHWILNGVCLLLNTD
ncbi:unnamed protein product [Adineta ricciae]|uniref:AAA+ ATPase domain-containing protein n=1 Tax=Adineta ricciae TaxID=249248 RepID=A0A814GC48_ADIRI|nr:unnamed protein product [Adineta ricciae]CAF0992443.1 unnamed protein product [Adineta ricciae]